MCWGACMLAAGLLQRMLRLSGWPVFCSLAVDTRLLRAFPASCSGRSRPGSGVRGRPRQGGGRCRGRGQPRGGRRSRGRARRRPRGPGQRGWRCGRAGGLRQLAGAAWASCFCIQVWITFPSCRCWRKLADVTWAPCFFCCLGSKFQLHLLIAVAMVDCGSLHAHMGPLLYCRCDCKGSLCDVMHEGATSDAARRAQRGLPDAASVTVCMTRFNERFYLFEGLGLGLSCDIVLCICRRSCGRGPGGGAPGGLRDCG